MAGAVCHRVFVQPEEVTTPDVKNTKLWQEPTKAWKDLRDAEKDKPTLTTVPFEQIDAVTLDNTANTGVKTKYFFTNFEFGAIKYKGENIGAMAVREMDQKMLTEENINGLYRQGRLIKVMSNTNTWYVSKAVFDRINEKGYGQIAIARRFNVTKDGKETIKETVSLRNVPWGMADLSSESYSTMKNILLDFIKADKSAHEHIAAKRANGGMTEAKADELKKQVQQSQVYKPRQIPIG